MIRNAKVEKVAGGLLSVTAPCVQTGKAYQVTVKESAYHAWQKGALIQNVMPELNADQREFLISGYSPEGWNIAMGAEPED
jgi:hypothetical protein